MPSATNPSPELLLDQVAWIRELARHLVADESARDDLVQETCVRALEEPPRDAGSVRRWLATVMRNLVRQRARGDGRRREREQHSSRDEALAATATVVQRVTLQRELVETVLELDEPYRTALLLRYFEELPPR
jgi:RNA polymerase sigma factor (sigma-70 family)